MLYTSFRPEIETHTHFLQTKAKHLGHYAMARWMLKQGYPFKYTHFICLGIQPQRDV